MGVLASKNASTCNLTEWSLVWLSVPRQTGAARFRSPLPSPKRPVIETPTSSGAERVSMPGQFPPRRHTPGKGTAPGGVSEWSHMVECSRLTV